MAVPTDLERRLRRYAEAFDDEVPLDDGFERRILARVAVTRREAGPKPPYLRELALAALLLLFVAVVGVTIAKLRVERPTPGGHEALSYVPSVVLTPGPIDLGSAFTEPFIRMLTPERGWAIGPLTSPSGARDAILLTEDGGSHWRNVTPPGFAPAGGRTAYFLDATHAWVAVTPQLGGSASTRRITVYRTADRARTWQSAGFTIGDAWGPGQLSFADPLHGWLVAGIDNGQAIYRTADSGVHWELASVSHLRIGLGPMEQASDGSLPLNQPKHDPQDPVDQPTCQFSRVAFRDASAGWAAGTCIDINATYFFVTHDAGKSWRPQPLMYPEGYPGPCQCWVSTTPPVFTSSRDGWSQLNFSTVVTTCETHPQGRTCATNTTPKLAILYTTHDGGKTWFPSTLPGPGENVALADSSHGWFVGRTLGAASDDLWATADGGRTWAQMTAINFHLGELSFATASTGWSIGFEPNTTHSIVFRTTDGGRTWEQLTPTLTG
jgi:photosystem II stability/assembly factor-like uncharacterized protein